MPMGVEGILTNNYNIQNSSGNDNLSLPHSNMQSANMKNGMSASMVKGQYNFQELINDENTVCGAFDDGDVDKQIMMMTSGCINLEQA